jgi:nucleotide-binding universal stress UspA family protein
VGPEVSSKEINLYIWREYTPPELLSAFEREFGVTARVSNYRPGLASTPSIMSWLFSYQNTVDSGISSLYLSFGSALIPLVTWYPLKRLVKRDTPTNNARCRPRTARSSRSAVRERAGRRAGLVSQAPVEPPELQIQTLLLATDWSEGAERLHAQAAAIATLFGAEVTAELINWGVQARAVAAEGSPADVILQVAQQEAAGLIVLGGGTGGTARYRMGSTAERVVRHATVPVYVFR